MKRLSLSLAILASLLIVSVASADMIGLDGRIYLTSQATNADGAAIGLKSFSISSDLTVGAVIDHGLISDVGAPGYAYNYAGHTIVGMTPFIEQSNPTGFATLFINSFWKDGTFAQNRAPVGGSGYSPVTLGVLNVTPTAAGYNATVATVGLGAGNAWGKGTDNARYIIPTTLYGLTAIVMTHGGLYALKDNNGDGDFANDVGDYTAVGGSPTQISGNRGFSSDYWGGAVYSYDAAGVQQTFASVPFDWSSGYFYGHFAAGQVNGETIVYAVGNGEQVYRYVDSNNDGVAESSSLFGYTVSGWQGTTDMRVVSSGANSFLMLLENGNALKIFSLNADGTMASSATVAVPDGTFNFNADLGPVPEPATMALLAIGGISMLIRRRKA